MIKSRTDYDCILREISTGKQLLAFSATAQGAGTLGADYEGGGVASASQTLTLFTQTPYAYKPLKHNVIVDGETYLIMSVSKTPQRRLGALRGGARRTVYTLYLE